MNQSFNKNFNLLADQALKSEPPGEFSLEELITCMTSQITPLGYQVIQAELQTGRQNILRVYIDHLHPTQDQMIGIEDCVQVSRTLDPFLDQSPEFATLFQGSYHLEVSSPGVNRPLRKRSDFEQFSGQSVKIQVGRPLTGEELGNPVYQNKNPKQKNFLGKLLGIQNNESVLLELTNEVQVQIPLQLISKAHLERE